MSETVRGEVIHVVGPDELDEYELEAELATMAESRYVLVCRDGGVPSVLERIWAVLRRRPIEPVTIVAERDVEEGTELTATVRETELAGVYRAVDITL
ncbi:MAG: hypothetical protein ABEJ79_12295 [Halolamina sp.]